MDWEAPVDGWYVWLAVSIVSVAIAGVVVGLPTGAPPDANQAANAMEQVAGSPHEASATYEHDADTVIVQNQTIEMANEHGTTHASINYGIVVPVNETERLENLTRGASFEDEYEEELADDDTHAVQTFLEEVSREHEETSGERLTASGDMAVRQLSVDSDIDGLEPLTETVEVESDSWHDSRFGEYGIRHITASYDGIDGNEVTLTVEGEYIGFGSFEETDEATFADGVGDLEVEIRSRGFSQPGSSPVDVLVDFESDSCRKSLSRDAEMTCTNTVDRSADLDADAPFVDYDSETETYHVTLVTV